MTWMRWPRRRTAPAGDAPPVAPGVSTRPSPAPSAGRSRSRLRVVTVPARDADKQRMTEGTVAEAAADKDVAAPHLAAIQDIYEEAMARIAGIMACPPDAEPSAGPEAMARIAGIMACPPDAEPSAGPEAEGSPAFPPDAEPSAGPDAEGSPACPPDAEPSAGPDAEGSPACPPDPEPSAGPEAEGSQACPPEPDPGQRSDTMRIDMAGIPPRSWVREPEADDRGPAPVASVAAQPRARRWINFWMPAATAGRHGSVTGRLGSVTGGPPAPLGSRRGGFPAAAGLAGHPCG